MTIEKPYFMDNEDWFYFDEQAFKYKLTSKATKKAIENYNEFYGTIEAMIEGD